MVKVKSRRAVGFVVELQMDVHRNQDLAVKKGALQ